MRPQLCKPVTSSTNAIRSVKFTCTKVKQTLFGYKMVVGNYDKVQRSIIHLGSAYDLHKSMDIFDEQRYYSSYSFRA